MMMALDGGGEHNFYTATPIILDYSANKSSPTMGRHPANVSRRRWDGRTDGIGKLGIPKGQHGGRERTCKKRSICICLLFKEPSKCRVHKLARS